MEYLILAIVIIVLVLMLKFIFKFNIKEIKEIGVNKKLDELTKKFPENTEICKWYLKKLNNTTTKIQENLESKNSMYIAITDKIIIANIAKILNFILVFLSIRLSPFLFKFLVIPLFSYFIGSYIISKTTCIIQVVFHIKL